MNFDITVNDGQVILDEQAVKILSEAKKLDLLQKKAKIQMDTLKAAIKKAMEDNGVKKFENDDVTVNYIAPTVSKTMVIDEDALKEQGLYDLFAKEKITDRKGYVKVAFKE